MKYLVKKIIEVKTVEELMRLENSKGVLEIEVSPFNLSKNEVRGLSPKQKKLFEFLLIHQNNYKKSPTLDIMRRAMEVGSINTIVDHLKALEKKGFITRYKHSKRNIKINK